MAANRKLVIAAGGAAGSNFDSSYCMFRSRRNRDNREQKRFYLFPGQGGRAYHRKQWYILRASLMVGLLVSALLWFPVHTLPYIGNWIIPQERAARDLDAICA